MDWMTGSLKQEIDRTYRTLPDRENTMIAGSSMGGLMSLYAVTAYNDIFSRAAALSPCIWFCKDRMYSLFSETPLLNPTQVYLDLGTGEIPPDGRSYLSEMFRCAAELSNAGADVAARAVPGAAHCEAAWEERIPVFMDYLWDRG